MRERGKPSNQMNRELLGPFIVEDRRMLSRVVGDRIRITHIIQPGNRILGCCTCCNAPDSCPLLAYCPCFDYPGYIVNEVNSSRYIYVRENSLEWNNPQMQSAKGNCCGMACCELVVMDDITVLYFDDMYFDDVSNSTRRCNDCKTFFCGGRGEQVIIDSRFCFGMCKRGRKPFFCVPSCFPDVCCPCFVKSELWVEDAKSAVETIKMVRADTIERLDL
mmetsp:Transcript_30897/g.35512  ORF Transcript_30897/g.35512 Transcript_30897/m.35512 type:complete len:219 (-) Transcript_30897:129-785(-)